MTSTLYPPDNVWLGPTALTLSPSLGPLTQPWIWTDGRNPPLILTFRRALRSVSQGVTPEWRRMRVRHNPISTQEIPLHSSSITPRRILRRHGAQAHLRSNGLFVPNPTFRPQRRRMCWGVMAPLPGPAPQASPSPRRRASGRTRPRTGPTPGTRTAPSSCPSPDESPTPSRPPVRKAPPHSIASDVEGVLCRSL